MYNFFFFSFFSGSSSSHEQEKVLCLVTYLSGLEFCFLGKDLEDCFQVGFSSLAGDLGSWVVSPVLVCRGAELGVWESGQSG